MRLRATSLLGAILRFLSWPFRWLWKFLGRLGLAERKLLTSVWRFLGRLGVALTAILDMLARLVWSPIHWLFRAVGKALLAVWRRLGIWGRALQRTLAWAGLTLWRPMRVVLRPIWALARWAAPFVWEELGRLGLAARRLVAVIAWPLAAPARLAWNRLLAPPVTRLWGAITLRALVARRAVRSRRQIRAARRHLNRREKAAAAHNRRPEWSPNRRRWTRAMAALLALNLVLLVLLARTLTDTRQQAEARLAPSPTLWPTAAPSRLVLPTSTLAPTPIPIAPAPTPDHLATGGSIAFVLRRHGNQDIHALTIGLDTAIQLTSDQADDRSPAWSPDGRLLAFASRRDGNWELYLLNVTNGELNRLTRHVDYEANPSWSPDGQWIVYESYHHENMDIYIIPVMGGDAIRLTSHPAADHSPVWAPSGRHIAFVSERGGDPDIYLLSLDDARDEAASNVTQSPEIAESDPSWHPGGDYLAYTAQAAGQTLVTIQPLADNLPSGAPIVIGQGREPAWAPSGNALVYAHDDQSNHYLLASSVNGWGAAPQVYLSQDQLGSPSWNAAALLPGIFAASSIIPGNRGTTTAADDSELYLESVADPASEGPPFTLVTLDDIQVPGPYLNDRVDDSFLALRQRVMDEIGWDFVGALSNMWEPLDTPPPPGLDAQSWNKAGRAFDIIPELNAGFTPMVEVVRELEGAKTWWRVYVRTHRQDGTLGEPLLRRPWNFQARYSGNTSDYEDGGRLKETLPPGYYVDFTQLAADYGWERVPADSTWRTNFPATLYWHFEKRQGLDWETTMLEIYSELELEPGTESQSQ